MTAPTRIALTELGFGTADPAGTAGDATNGNVIRNDGKVRLRVKNTNGASTARILTVNIAEKVDGQTVTPRTVSVAAGATVWFDPFPPDIYGDDLSIGVANAELVITAFHG